jgi:transposase InsO family protein
MLGVDILCGLPETPSKHKLVFTDNLSRWAQAFPMNKIDAKTVAKLFIDEIVCRYSAPKTLLSDQGAQFMSILLKNICNYLNTKKINTTEHHPQCNGLTERFNATLCVHVYKT